MSLLIVAFSFSGLAFAHGQQEKTVRLGNNNVTAVWATAENKIRAVEFDDLINHKRIVLPPELFTLLLRDGTKLGSSEMSAAGPLRTEKVAANASASRMAERIGGMQLVADLRNADASIQIRWRAILSDGSQYIRQEITISSEREDLPITEVRLIDLNASGARVAGTVKGSPIIAGTFYFGFEHPLSESTADGGQAAAWIERELPLRKGTTVTYSSVMGVARVGQMRRDFLAYIERERAHPYRTFLHYNSWYDIGYFSKYDESAALDRIKAFGIELHQNRGVTIDSYLFDDGWDEPATLWQFHSGFPRGFAPLREAAAKYGAGIGVWISPWGGYGKPHDQRVKFGKEQGYETNKTGFALSGPKYYRRFHDAVMQMVREYNINQLKIDGTGNVNSAIPGSEFDSDFSAAIQLMDDLRAEKPDIFINLTTGTYASPFWLRYADSVWRGGEDHDFAGVGTKRQQWITYRDADTYAGIVKAGPLYPLNSVMLHGMIYAQKAKNLETDPQNDFADEVHSYFGSGTGLQEMYITPLLLSTANWDTIAEAAEWSRANADVLVDSHWVGGNPKQLEVYGWAAWSPRNGILTLRNPSASPHEIALDLAQVFEVPAGAAKSFLAHSPWTRDRNAAPIRLSTGKRHTFQLAPFQVLNLEMTPADSDSR
ncbi:MAG: enterotoxin [Verrucomicrobia bacterium]|nr:enterotoxin [Verrucomicrobiota bacterium]